MRENIVYKITNKINNKIYIGCTTQGLKDRKQEHYSRCFKVGYKSKLCDSMRKHGFDNFEFEIIKECETSEEMFSNEIYYIGFYNSKEKGYNLTIGGEGCLGYKHTEETKKFLSNFLTENHPYRGKKYEEIYDIEKVEEQKKKRAESVKKHWESLNEQERVNRTKKQKELGEIRRKNGLVKCGKNPFAKQIVIDGTKYDCWSEAVEKLKMSVFKIKKRYKIITLKKIKK
jgi:group I intron endonuclease